MHIEGHLLSKDGIVKIWFRWCTLRNYLPLHYGLYQFQVTCFSTTFLSWTQYHLKVLNLLWDFLFSLYVYLRAQSKPQMSQHNHPFAGLECKKCSVRHICDYSWSSSGSPGTVLVGTNKIMQSGAGAWCWHGRDIKGAFLGKGEQKEEEWVRPSGCYTRLHGFLPAKLSGVDLRTS